jgi:hypothetical protein
MVQVEERGEVKDSLWVGFDVEFISIAPPLAEQLNFVVRIACGSSSRGSAPAKAVACIELGVQAS